MGSWLMGWTGAENGEWRSEEVVVGFRTPYSFVWNWATFEEMPESKENLGVREMIFPPYYDHPQMTISFTFFLFALNWDRM